LKIYSNEAYLVVKKITVGKKRLTLFDAAIRKISILLSLAKQEQVYPICKLYEIKQQMDAMQTEIEAAIAKTEQQLAAKKINPEQYNFTVKDEITIKFGNPLIYQLAKLLEQFDRLICLLNLAKSTDITLSKRLYFTEKDKYQQMLFRFLSSVVQIGVDELPKTSIESYIQQIVSYSECKEANKISPQIVHTALQLSLLPQVDVHKIEEYNHQLKLI
ncbi:MAG: hypothetical protein ACK4PR_12965, partial [Gammaproteobacteria bacterium]